MATTELFDNGRVVARLIGSRIEIIWTAPTGETERQKAESEMPSQIGLLLDALRPVVADREPGSLSLLLVVRGVNKRYADILGAAVDWLRNFRHVFSICVFATSSALLRSSIKVLGLIPGLELRGFETEEEARRFLEARGA